MFEWRLTSEATTGKIRLPNIFGAIYRCGLGQKIFYGQISIASTLPTEPALAYAAQESAHLRLSHGISRPINETNMGINVPALLSDRQNATAITAFHLYSNTSLRHSIAAPRYRLRASSLVQIGKGWKRDCRRQYRTKEVQEGQRDKRELALFLR